MGDYDEMQRLDSYVALTQFPKGVDPTAVFSVFKPSFRRMQEGFRILAGPAGAKRLVFYHGGIGLLKGDYPQAQAFAGCLSQAALYPDRFSHIHADSLADLDYDLALNRKTLDERRSVRAVQAADPTSTETKKLVQAHGLLAQPSAFEDPAIFLNPLVQVPPMNEHSELLGMAGMLLTAIMNDFTQAGKDTLIEGLKQQPLPPHWPPLAPPRLSTSNSSLMLGVEDIKHTMQLLPFVVTSTFLQLPPQAAAGQAQARKAKSVVDQIISTFTGDALAKYHCRPNKAKGIQIAVVAAALSSLQNIAWLAPQRQIERRWMSWT